MKVLFRFSRGGLERRERERERENLQLVNEKVILGNSRFQDSAGYSERYEGRLYIL